ncbi:hypothetical protein B0J11DRAFT_199184 [Dendryphion nanum]|uniref:MHYT domain-containing protein n=1 Tax=Dendryphion nanum TaxID=256645 RepID=A0A9P9D2A1_9PLEO|nr:hypothetical protein B0J11DRAFT_199184 [Dendryphion nanum]
MESLPNKYQRGELVPYHFTPWIILLSYFVSLIGAETTVELLHRRCTGRGLISQYALLHLCGQPVSHENGADKQDRLHLGLCAISFGLVAIWCMHFVGNKAIVMGDGRTEIQLSYSAGYTALSAVIPITVLYLGFSVVDRHGKTKRSLYLSLIITGLAAGLSVTGMHYVGNLGTSNYTLENNYKHVIGAAAIAVFDCWFSFTIFFHQREHWINYWWRRLLCAALLAAAVSGMHWTATVGTNYRLRTSNEGNSQGQNVNVILASVMCMIALIGCMILFYWTNIHRSRLAKRAHQVVLAAVIRDEHGKVLVTQEGLLPCQTITTEFYQHSLSDHFDTSHPVFHWMYRISHNWGAIADLIPTMREYLTSVSFPRENSISGIPVDTQSGSDASKLGKDWLIFRAQFCVAAQDLANDLDIRLHDLGALHTELIITGIDSSDSQARPLSGNSKLNDVESSKPAQTFGKGQIIMISQNVDMHEAEKLVAFGFRFATLANISGKSTRVLDILATKMQVRKLDFLSTLRIMRPVSLTTILMELGPDLKPNSHYISLFALRPRFKSSNCQWDVMVYKDDLSMIPSISCGIGKELDPGTVSMLRNLEGKTPDDMYSFLNGAKEQFDSERDHEGSLVDRIMDTIRAFRKHIPQPIFQNALFCSTPIRVPVIGPIYRDQAYSTIWSFSVILDVHNLYSGDQNDKLWSWIPFNFFQCLQLTRQGSEYHAILARKSYIELSTLFSEASRQSTIKSSRTPTILGGVYNTLTKVDRKIKTTSSQRRTPPTFTHYDNSSEKELVCAATKDCGSQTSVIRTPLSFGGIMVSQDIIVQSDAKIDPNIELQNIGLKSTVGVATNKEPTWVDDLYFTLVRKWVNKGYRENRWEKWVS